MNRRQFTKSLAATAVAPALPLPAGSANAAQIVSDKTLRFLAIYLSGLQGKFTPAMVSKMTGADHATATRITNDLVSKSVIEPHHAAGHVAVGQAFPLPRARLASQANLSDQIEQAKTAVRKLGELTDDVAPDAAHTTTEDDHEQT